MIGEATPKRERARLHSEPVMPKIFGVDLYVFPYYLQTVGMHTYGNLRREIRVSEAQESVWG